MDVKPYPGDVVVIGPNTPKCEHIDDLIRLLVTIRERWGNTAVKYRVSWGASALWAQDGMREEIDRLKKRVKRLQAKQKK